MHPHHRRHHPEEDTPGHFDGHPLHRGGHREHSGPGRRGGGHHPGGPGGRARRGEARYVLLEALLSGPKHGYEIIKALEERSGGQYAPSPGTVYPTLQYLEDRGLVRAEQEGDRRIYHLTEAGKADLTARADELAAFWKRLEGPVTSPATRTEIGFLQDEQDHFIRAVWSGLQNAFAQNDTATIRRVREKMEQCRKEIQTLIAQQEE